MGFKLNETKTLGSEGFELVQVIVDSIDAVFIKEIAFLFSCFKYLSESISGLSRPTNFILHASGTTYLTLLLSYIFKG